MAAEALEQAIASTRAVLAQVSPDQLADPTPCAQWTVADVINHVVGAQSFFTAGATGEPPAAGDADPAAGDFVAAFDEASQQCLSAFQAEGVMQRMLTLPFGQMPGIAVAGLAATDTFVHGWDLAKAIGADTDLAPELAAQLLASSKMAIQPAFRSAEGTVFGPEQQAPEGAPVADQLAAFLGRTV